MNKRLLKNIEKKDEEKQYLKNGLRILARIIVREELKKQSLMRKQIDASFKERKLIPISKIYSK